MNQKGFANIVLMVVIVVLVAVAGYFILVKKPTSNNTISNWKVYQNERHHFTLRIPNNLVAITQNDNLDLSDFLFIDENDLKAIKDDPLFKDNPFLVALDHNANGLHLYRNASAWIEKSEESDIKSYLSASAGGPSGGIDVVLKDFMKRTDTNGQTIYLYTQELQTKPAVQSVGALWISGGIMYQLTELNREKLPSKEMLFMIAESFTEIK